MANWFLQNSTFTAITGNVTTMHPCNHDNASAIVSGSLGIVSVTTGGTCTAVSDNTNGSYTKIGVATNTGVEVSLWYFFNMGATAANSLIVTVTTTSAHGASHFRSLDGQNVAIPNGALMDFATGSGTSSTPSLSVNNYSSGNFIVGAFGNASNVDTDNSSFPTSAVSGDFTTVNTDGALQDIIQQNPRCNTLAGDTNTGLRSAGINYTASVAWAGVIAAFWWTNPAGAFQGDVGGWVNIKAQERVSNAWSTAQVWYKKSGTWVQKSNG